MTTYLIPILMKKHKGLIFWIGGILLSSFIILFLITQPLVFYEQSTINVSVSPKTLQRHVWLLSKKFPPRLDAKNLEVSAAYIQRQFKKSGGRVEVQKYTVADGSYRNISVLFGPETSERIVVGAHYDTFDGLPGADDNASGVAGLIELAKLLGKANLKKTVELVAYSTEEPPDFRTGEMGSAFHAKRLKEQKINVIVMISLEMIGYFTDAPNSQAYPAPLLRLLYPRTGNYIAIVGKFSDFNTVRRMKKAMIGAMEVPVYSINAPAFIPGIDFSDHLNYWRYGYPALMVTDTAFYRNRAYHTENDVVDTLDYKRMADVVVGIYAAVLTFSRG